MDSNQIAAVAACIAAVGAVIGGVRSFFNGRAISEVHLTMNSRLSELIAASVAQARSEGHAEGAASIDPAVTALAAEKVLQVAKDKAAL